MAYRETQQVKNRKAATRDKIRQATWQLVAKHGFRQVQMSHIASTAGIAVGTLYKYFPTKDALFAELFQIATEREVQAVEEALEQQGSAAEKLAKALRVFAQRALKNPTMAWALIAEPVDPAVDTERLIYRARYAQAFERVIQTGIDQNQLPPQAAMLSSNALVGAIAESLVGPLAPTTHHPVTDADTLVNNIIRFCLQGLGAATTTSRKPE